MCVIIPTYVFPSFDFWNVLFSRIFHLKERIRVLQLIRRKKWAYKNVFFNKTFNFVWARSIPVFCLFASLVFLKFFSSETIPINKIECLAKRTRNSICCPPLLLVVNYCFINVYLLTNMEMQIMEMFSNVESKL